MSLKQAALDYHRYPKPGKLSVEPSKPAQTQRDLSLAYSPGVAEPVREIEKNPATVYDYTNKGNLVAVISNGTAVLGLGNTGALASKPVMEGKALLFKRFAGIDCYDIEVNQTDIEAFITTVKAIAPTFGGINLEDIAAPACFEIERRLIEELDIPVFHDDQHGTAIITLAGLLNAAEIQGKNFSELQVVLVGAGAAGLSIGSLLQAGGLPIENITLVDSKGVVHSQRSDLNAYKLPYAKQTSLRTLADAMVGADVFLGVSQANLLSQDMVKSMADKPIIFAMANPDPEILPEAALAARPDCIMATGRSDYPNQVNNVLGFPFIFRGALDCKAREINLDMKLACAYALRDLAKESVPQEVLDGYGLSALEFGREYIIPKPIDSRLIECVPQAIMAAARRTGAAKG